MKTIESSAFRMSYARLEEPHEVTVLGRVIGIWTPVQVAVPDDIPALRRWVPEFNPAPKPGGKKRK